jgi:PAS domain S-box-containing protein
MQQQAPHQRHPAYYWIVLGCVLSVVFWIAESGIEAGLFGEHSFSAQLFRPEPIEIYHRLYIGGLWLAFSLCAFTVVRQRTRADKALRESEARFRDLIEWSLQGILIHRDDQALFVNQAYADIFGYETPDAISRLETLESLIAPSELDRLRRYRNDRLAGKEVPTHYEYQGIRQDGSLVWLDMQVRVVIWQGVPAVQSTVFDITERKKAEEAMRQSEERFRHLVEGSIQGIMLHRDGKPIFANQAYAEMYGYDSPEDILGVENIFQDIIAPEDRARLQQYFQARMRGEPAPTHYTCRGVRRDGTYIWVDNIITVVTWKGETTIQCTMVDISERTQAETALQRSEAQHRALVEGSLQGITILTQEGMCLFANQAFATMYGWATPEEIIGQSILQWVASHERPRMTSYLAARLRGETTPVRYEFQGCKQDGTLVWAEALVSQIEWEGCPAHLFTCIDITERKQAEEALRASEELNRRIVEAVPGGITQVSPEGSIVRANAEAARILGLVYDDLLKRFVADFALQTIWEDGSPCAVQDYPVTKCLATHQPQAATTIGVRRPDGTVSWAVFTAIPLWDPTTGGVTGALVTFLDITERKRAEEDRKRLEEQLHQGQKMEALGTLSGGIAHEFNNILAAIMGFTELAIYALPASHPACCHLQAVLLAGNRAKDLVQQILAFSRPSERDRKPVQVARVIQEALALLRATLPTTIEIRQHFPEQEGTVLAHRNQLHQVIMNLCTNAEYAMRQTGGILEIGVDTVDFPHNFTAHHRTLPPGAYVCLTLRDTGQGMTPDIVEHIFEPFFTTKGVGEGTGMGLAIVHGIVTSHGGAITVESTPGQGTTFTIYLPRIDNAAPTETTAPAQGIHHGKGRILFVDDEEMLAHVGQKLLTHLGYDAVACTSSLDALDTFRAAPQHFDLVITDQTMPAMTGVTLVAELRRIRPDIPIILCTGFSHLINAEKAQALGVDAFVMKPGVTQELAVTIQQVLDQRAAQKR